jgi:hypothetical protein
MVGSGRAGWRQRWAVRENADRQQAYQAALAAWQYHDDDLRAMHAAAVSFVPDPALPAPVALRRDELPYLMVYGVQAVEAPHVQQLPAPAATPFPVPVAGGPLPQGLRSGDFGTAVITSRRVMFVGPRANREWAFPKLVGLLHDPASPLTLMRVSNRKTVSGLLVDARAAAGFRLLLQLAVADAGHGRRYLVAHLEHLIAAHGRQRPAPPVAVEPGQAPLRAGFTRGRLVAAAAATVGLFALIGALTSGSPDPSVPAAAQLPTATAAQTRAATGSTVQSPVPAQAAAPSPARSSRTPAGSTPAPVRTSPEPKPKKTSRSPAPKAADLCGAPANPYGYTFCGGSRIRDPEPDVCSYFACIPAFDDGVGYMIQCADGMVGMSGGRPGSCSRHGGNRRPVYR